MRIDVHAHLAGVGTQGTGCWTAAGFQRRITFRLLRRLYGISEEQARESVDQDWVRLLGSFVRTSGLDRAVALGFDGVYRADGSLDHDASQMLIPPGWVFEACRREPGTLLPGPSINPRRADALERLEEAISLGAVLLKWLPAVQGIDPSDRRHLPFYRSMRDAGLPLLVHSGGREVTFREVERRFQGLELLSLPLEEGVKVIVAHCGAPVHYSRDRNQIPLLREMLRRYPHLWVDNSGMANPSRFLHLQRFARDPEIRDRTLYGSDFPVPASSVYFAATLGARRTWRLQRIRNPLRRDLEIKRALGYDDGTETRAARVLANLERWADPAPRETPT